MTHFPLVALLAVFPPDPIEAPALAPTPGEKLTTCRIECLGMWSDCEISAYVRWVAGELTDEQYLAASVQCDADWDACTAGCYFEWAAEILAQ
jgi:hypothetical protein